MKKNCLLLLMFIIVVFFSMNMASASDDYVNGNNIDHSVNSTNTLDNSLNSNDIYVNLSGNDVSGDGSENNPYKSLKKAINEASNNSNIYIMPGEYFGENNTKMIIDKTITISGINGGNGKVIFNGERSMTFLRLLLMVN